MEYPRDCVAVKQLDKCYPIYMVEQIEDRDSYFKLLDVLDRIADEYATQLKLVLMVPTDSIEETERRIEHNCLAMPELAELADYIYAELHCDCT